MIPTESDWTAIKRQALQMAQRKFGSYDPPLSYVIAAIRELRLQADTGQREMFE